MANQNFELPIWNIDARNVLNTWGKKVKEEPITSAKDVSMQAPPSKLALLIMAFSESHLDYVIAGSTQAGLTINIDIKQKTQLYFEFLTLYYFLIGNIVSKYLKGDQFTLFLLQLHVELLENLPKYKDSSWLFGKNPFTRVKKIEEYVGKYCANTNGLSRYIYKGDDFYINDKLISDGTGVWNIWGESTFVTTNDEIQGYESLKRLLLPADAKANDFEKYKENLFSQFKIKNFHLVMKILRTSLPSWDKDVQIIFFLYGRNSEFISSVLQSKFIANFRPAWDAA